MELQNENTNHSKRKTSMAVKTLVLLALVAALAVAADVGVCHSLFFPLSCIGDVLTETGGGVSR